MSNEQQNQTTTLYPVKQTRYEGKEIHVYAQNFPIADKWFADNVMQGKVDFNHLEFDLENENATFIEKVMDIKSVTPQFSVGEKASLYDKLTKGYDPSTGCYVFSMVNEFTRKVDVEAATPEEALQKVRDGMVNLPDEETTARSVYACSEDERCIVDGVVVKYCNEEELTERLRQEFPDGLTVTLESESLKNLLDYRSIDEDGEWVTLSGTTAKDGIMAGAYGNLAAKLELKPEDYSLVFACDKTYWAEELSEMGWDSDANATSMLLAQEEDMKDIRVQAGVSEELLKHLMIDGRPYSEVMDMVQKYHIQEEKDLVHLFNTEFLERQPDWKKLLAEEQTKEVINKFWVSKTAPAWFELKKMFTETQNQAAQENGYKDANEWQRDVKWSKNPSPVLTEKMRSTEERWRELYTPYEKKYDKVYKEMTQLKASEQRAFIERFDRRALQAVSNVKVIQRGAGELAIRCMVDGVQQMGRTLNKEHSRIILEAPSKNMREMAACYFKDEIVDSMQQARQQGMKR